MPKSQLATLLSLGALAALAIAPAHAMAVANNPSAGECRAPGAGDTVVLIGGQLCAANQGSGGNAGTGTGALPGGRQPGEVVWVTGEIPECLRNPARCLPGQIGGRGGLEIKDGPGGRGGELGRRGGSGSAGSAEKTKTGKKRGPTTPEECRALSAGAEDFKPTPGVELVERGEAKLGHILADLRGRYELEWDSLDKGEREALANQIKLVELAKGFLWKRVEAGQLSLNEWRAKRKAWIVMGCAKVLGRK